MKTRAELQTYSKVPLELAEKVVKILHEITGNKVNFMGTGGIILASAQPERVGTTHEGGKIIMSGQKNEIAITREMAATMEGALHGYNGAVKYQGERVGCIGIGGEPEQVKPLQQLAELIIIEELERNNDQNERSSIIRNIVDKVKDISERMGVLSLNGSIQAARLGEKGGPFKVVAHEMQSLAHEVSDLIVQIEEQTVDEKSKNRSI
jgi:hypothetical protein